MSLETKLDYSKRRLLAQKWDPDRVDDALQEACLKALEVGLDLSTVSAQWLYVTARNRAINVLKHDAKVIPISHLNLNGGDADHNILIVDYKLDSTSDKLSLACEELLHPGGG